MPKTPQSTATLEESVASQVADLLIEAADVREKAAASPAADAELLSVAESLESDAVKWEKRLNWWKFLQRKKRQDEGSND